MKNLEHTEILDVEDVAKIRSYHKTSKKISLKMIFYVLFLAFLAFQSFHMIQVSAKSHVDPFDIQDEDLYIYEEVPFSSFKFPN